MVSNLSPPFATISTGVLGPINTGAVHEVAVVWQTTSPFTFTS